MAPNSSLLQWLATFQLDGQPAVELKEDAFYNMADGFVCARILNQISPQYFTDKWLDGIKPVPPNGSWRLRLSNLKRILQKIHDYASDLQSPRFKQPSAIGLDVAVIAQNFDADQISRLIQLILFCAINCDRKQDYIDKIRTLPTQILQDIKEAIEEMLVNNNDGYNQKLNTSHSSNCSMELDKQQTPNDSRLSNLNASNLVSSPARSSLSNTTTQKSFLRSDISGDNSKKIDFDISSQSNYNDNSNDTIEELKQKLNKAIAIKDEKAQSCHELELKLEQLRLEKEQLAHENERLNNEKSVITPRKLSDASRPKTSTSTPRNDIDLTFDSREIGKRYNNLDEDDDKTQNLILQQNKKLQSEVNKLKESLIKIETEKEDYRLKSALLKEDLDRITMKHDKLTHKAEQAKRLQDELDEIKHSSEKADNYKNMVENLVKKNNDMKRDLKLLEEENLVHKHRIVILEEENGRLNGAIKEIGIYKKQLQEVQIKLSQETYKADKAEVDLVRLSERYNSVKKEYEKLCETTNHLFENGLDTTTIRAEISPESFNRRGGGLNNTEISENTLTLLNKVEELQRQVFQKDQELTDLRIKYNNNIQKAKKVVETLNNNQSINNSLLHHSCISSPSSFNCSSIDEMNLLKQQLKEREQRIVELQRDFYEFKKFKEVHERLIISAFYGLTTTLQWKNAEKRLERTTLTSPPNTASSSINHSKHSN